MLKESIQNGGFSNERKISNYNELTKEYNTKVKEANALIKKVGARYYILPRGKGRTQINFSG